MCWVYLYNLNDDIPTDSTYYLFRKRIHEHQRLHNEDLLGKTFELITRQQIIDFEVNGKIIRMDSKLIGSNIAYFSRYEIIHQTLTLFYKTLKAINLSEFAEDEKLQLKNLLEEEPVKTLATCRTFIPLFPLAQTTFAYNFAHTIKAVFLFITFHLLQS